MSAARRRGVAAVAACAATALGMHELRGVLTTPSIRSWPAAEAWYESVGPTIAAMAALRIFALVVAVWLGVAIAMQVLASLSFGQSLRHVADGLSPGWVRRVGHGMAGLSLTAGLAVPAAAPAMPFAVGPSVDPVSASSEPVPDEGIATMRPVPADTVAASPTTTTTITSSTTTSAPPAPVPPAPVPPAPPMHTVAPGDSCWRIAVELLDEAPGPAHEAQVWELWIRLIELNRDRFVTGDPDVIYPGQVLLLPDVER